MDATRPYCSGTSKTVHLSELRVLCWSVLHPRESIRMLNLVVVVMSQDLGIPQCHESQSDQLRLGMNR